MNLLNDVFLFAASRYQENVVYDNAPNTFSNVSHVDYSSDYDKYNRLVREVQTLLYPGSEHTVLGIGMEQMQIKNKQGKTKTCSDVDIALMKKVLPKGNSCPKNFDQVKRMLVGLGLDHQKIDACVNNCILYYKDNNDEVECPHCYEPRYEASTSSKQKKPIPRKVLRYFSLGPRLQCLYMSSHTAKHMRWHQARHQGEERIDPDNLTHPADGEAWKHFDRSFPEFAGDCRNVRLGLATDGFNPTGNMNLSYSIWHVIEFPYNLPLNMCMRKEYNFFTLMVPGPCSPGKCWDVYMRPLIDKLQELWENGLPTFDRHGQTLFMMKAAVIWTISDFPAYGMLSGQQTKGYKTCPVCIDDVNSSWHADKICLLGSRRHLPEDHQWRWDADAFDVIEEHNPKPLGRSGEWILERLNQHWFGYLSTSKEVTNLNPPTPDEFKYWTHKSVFFELLYWSTLKFRHNLDVMHIEKNICDSVLGTILNLKHKNKDTPKVRVNLKMMGNIARCIKTGENKISGLKTHDCHVLLQRLLPVVIRPYLQSDMVDTLVALSKFFQRICAKELKKSDVRSLLSNSERLSNDEIKEAHWCVLQHCEEPESYFKSHLERQYGNEVIHKRDFPDYFPIWMMQIQQEFPASYDPELHLLAGGPQSHRVRAGCFVNGVKFVTSERDEGHVTQNNRVMVEGLGFNYYGILPKYEWDENDEAMFNWILMRAHERYKDWNDMVDEVNKRNDAFKEQHPDATEEQIMESVQSQQIEVLGTVLKTRKGKEIRGMGRGGERDLSHSSNGSTSRSRPPKVDEQQLQEVQQWYEQRLKESEDRAQQQLTEVQRRAQQQFQEVQQRALHAESMYSAVQSQVAALYEYLGFQNEQRELQGSNETSRKGQCTSIA
uniref:uncharacterized protein LOC101292880 n=1 Tax=Fragaria vesca subsp. vesca TaxID=101020 RepID=UPI0005CA2EC4|nr:PREDICTED: uncharacterized protein LOC101292880 [Fragaria vesca subsp. vesca]